jgi:hypothetical protein
MKMLSEMSAKQAGLRVRTGLQGGRDADECKACYRQADENYFGKNTEYLKGARNYCCTEYCKNSGCLRDINKTAEEFFE